MSDMDNQSRGRHFKTEEERHPEPLQPRNPYVPSSVHDAYDSSYKPVYGLSSSSHAQGPRRKDRKKAPFVLLGAILVLIVAISGVGVSAFFSAKNLKAKASGAMSAISAITDSVKAQDFSSASQAAQSLADLTREMTDGLDSPLWTAVSLMPVYGQDITSARTLVGSLDKVATDALVPVLDALEANPPAELISSDKTINVAAATQLFEAVGDAAPSLAECAETVESLPQFALPQLEEIMGPARQKLSEVNALVQGAADFSPLAAPVLGAEGNRTYLIVAQNSAEMRASGGFPGSMGTLRIQDGKIELDEFSKVYDVMEEATPASMGITDAERALFGGFMDVARDAGMDPDFPRVAAIWAAAYEEKTGVQLDGVISVTPAVVQDLLAIAGSITLEDGTVVDGSNATKVLQHDLYWNYLSKETSASGNGDLTDALFAQAADLAFEKFFSGLNSGTLMQFAELMAKGVDNRSVMFWLSDETEQDALSALDCSGSVLTDASEPAVGTYFSLWIGSKMGWYIDIDNQVLSSSDNADGSRTYHVQTTFANTATSDIIETAGDYISGYLDGFDRDNLYPELYIYAPSGGSISTLEASNGAEFVEAEHEGLQVFHASRPNLRAGESIVCTYEVTTAPGAAELTFMSTPTLTKYRE